MGESILMRVAYVSLFPEMVGGGEHSLLELMMHLPDSYTPILITPAVGEFTQRATQQGIQIINIPMPALGARSFVAIYQWIKTLREIQPDIIHANNSRAAFYAAIAGKLLRIPVIFHCRIAQADGLMDAMLKRLVSAVICNSKAVALRFADVKLPVRVIYNGVNTEVTRHPLNSFADGQRVLLFVGRLSQEKQLDKALQVFSSMAQDDESLHLIIVGGDDVLDVEYADNLRSWSQQQSWAKRVHWMGQQDDVAKYYAAADLLILTSKHEGFGRVLVEAMAQKLPLVAFAVGGVPEVFENGRQGVLIEPDDVDAMVNACRDLLVNPKLRQEMGLAGEKRALTFSMTQHVEQVEQLYKDVLEQVRHES